MMFSFFLSVPRPPPRSTLFPYTTLFRSKRERGSANPAVKAASPPVPGRIAQGRRRWLHATFGKRLALSRSEEHTSELQSQSNLVCRLLLEKKKKNNTTQKPNK